MAVRRGRREAPAPAITSSRPLLLGRPASVGEGPGVACGLAWWSQLYAHEIGRGSIDAESTGHRTIAFLEGRPSVAHRPDRARASPMQAFG